MCDFRVTGQPQLLHRLLEPHLRLPYDGPMKGNLFRRTVIIIALVTLVVGLFLVISALINRRTLESWAAEPPPPGELVQVDDYRLYVRDIGGGEPVVVFLGDVGIPGSQWWPMQDDTGIDTRTVAYERAGYAWSELGPMPRTSRTIIDELHTLLGEIDAGPPYLLVGHSFGGVYAHHYARVYPEEVGGAVLLEPGSFKLYGEYTDAENSRLVRRVERRRMRPMLFAALGFMRIADGLDLLPRYIDNYGIYSETTRDILRQLMNDPAYHHTMQSEEVSMYGTSIPGFQTAPAFPDIPLTIVTRKPPTVEDYSAEGAGIEQAEAMAQGYREYVDDYLGLSGQSEWVVAEESGRMIHLDRPELVVSKIAEMIDRIRAR